ncbi:GDP-L-fucose synthase [Vanrija pseudolonga]|uniref:GDP-L-fucose synthase n=1 Tax=Vanrija pseudolonga TaxID=143232 RepID=A0AAF1BJR7_9TREE|nr:GDP-L-fucose synthase [Vanrija pseudolonga]
MAQLTPVILVTGGTGLVGRAIQHAVASSGPFGRQTGDRWVFVSSSDCDLRDFDATHDLFDRVRPTHVVHLAARVGGLFANIASQADFLRDNIRINDAVLQNSHDFHVRRVPPQGAELARSLTRQVAKVVSCLSTCIFPTHPTYPLSEGQIHAGPPDPSNFEYAHAKRLVDVQNRAYREQYGDVFTAVIPTNVFGPGDNYNLDAAHVLPALMHKCYIAQRDGTRFVISGSGRPLRQFIYSRDLARLIVWALNSYTKVEPLILSPPENDEVSILDAALAVMTAMSYEGEYVQDTSKSDGQYRKPASNAKLVAELAKQGLEFEFTPFQEALQESVDWFVDNYHTDARI